MLFSKAAIFAAAAAFTQLVHAQSSSSTVTVTPTGTSTSSAPSSTNSDQVKVIVVQVGDKDGNLKFTPSDFTAAVGDMVQFQFWPKNHSVAQSSFDKPCTPISADTSAGGVAGFFSGFMPVTQETTMMPTFTIRVNDTKPIWFYCGTGQHCQNGMVGVINAPKGKTLAEYQTAAGKATTVVPGGESGGQIDPDGPSGPKQPIGGSGNSTTSPSGTPSGTATDSSTSPTGSGGGASMLSGSAMSGLLGAAAAAFFLV